MRTLASRRLFPVGSAAPPVYLMAYNGWDDVHQYGIGIGISGNDLAWTKLTADVPAISAGASGTWNQDGSKDPCMLKFGPNDFRMWFAGWSNTTGKFQIGYATSTDGVVWYPYLSNPVLTYSASGWDSAVIEFPLVLYEPSDSAQPFKMWYIGGTSLTSPWPQNIGYAYSSDGINWTKYSGNPVLSVGSTGSYDAAAVYCGSVVNIGGTYYMFYGGAATSANPNGVSINLATFTNPEGTYTKSGSNPLLSPSSANQTLTSSLAGGSVTVHVTDTSLFHAGEPCLMMDSALTRADVKILSVDSGTQMTLVSPASASYSYTTGNGSTIRSAYTGSVFPRTLFQLNNQWIMHATAYQQFGGNPYSERMIAATSSSLTSGWSFDYVRGLMLPLGPHWDTVSTENPSMLRR